MEIIFFFYEGMTALDAVGPHEVLCRLPNANVRRVATHSGLIRTDSGLFLRAEYALSDISYADILIIPGAGNATSLRDKPETLAWIRSLHEKTLYTVSVCTGSLILAAAGLLNALRATTHWAALNRLHLLGAIPVQERVVEDGKIITSAGVSAGIDMALMLASKIAGQQFAESLQLGIEYDPKPPYDVGSPTKANPKILEGLRARMVSSFEKQESIN